ncbi:hypothetical protein LINGRAHAP2_LOCUS12974 [Linum grandiflorum]
MTFKILSFAIVVLLATTISLSSAFEWPWHRDTYYVHVINELTEKSVLWAQCKCTDNSQPPTDIYPGSEYELTFKEHLFRPTVWSCFIIKDNDSQVWFYVFDPTIRRHSLKYNVYWAVKDDGVYSRHPGYPDEFAYEWQPRGSLESASNL